MGYYNAGWVFGEPVSYNNLTVTPSQPVDIFAFTAYGGREVTLNLHDISANDDVNLTLWRDQNGDGFYDAADVMIGLSAESGNADEVISFTASPGFTYFARVNRAPGSISSVAYDFDLSAHRNVGSLASTPQKYTGNLNSVQSKEVYEFQLSGTGYIHLTLDNWLEGESDLRLYQDNGNSFLDDDDTLVAASVSGDRYESINHKANSGTYFATVDYVTGGLLSSVDYDIAMSATGINKPASNLVVGEVVLGDLTNTPDQTGMLGDSNTTDVYSFTLDLFEAVNIKMTGLTSNADLTLVRDSNHNGIVDEGEIVDSSHSLGSSDEQMYAHVSGKYFLMAHQAVASGETAYTLEFDHYTTPYP